MISFKIGEQAFQDNKNCIDHYDPAIPQLPKPIDSIPPHPVHQQQWTPSEVMPPGGRQDTNNLSF